MIKQNINSKVSLPAIIDTKWAKLPFKSWKWVTGDCLEHIPSQLSNPWRMSIFSENDDIIEIVIDAEILHSSLATTLRDQELPKNYYTISLLSEASLEGPLTDIEQNLQTKLIVREIKPTTSPEIAKRTKGEMRTGRIKLTSDETASLYRVVIFLPEPFLSAYDEWMGANGSSPTIADIEKFRFSTAAIAGRTNLTPDEINSLQVNDIVLIDEHRLEQNALNLFSGGRVIGSVTTEHTLLQDNFLGALSAPFVTAMPAAKETLSFEVHSIDTTLYELAHSEKPIFPGIDLGNAVPLIIHRGPEPIGKGELLKIGDTFGARITEIRLN